MAEQQAESALPADRIHFLVRRLHSLTGLVPVGAFLCIHLVTNGSIMFSHGEQYRGEHFQTWVERIHWLEPYLIPIEIVFIFIPLLFHALIGFQIWFSGKSNVQQYRYGGNIRYALQRATGILAFVFIAYHLWQLHWLGKPFGAGGAFELVQDGVPAAARTTAEALQSAAWIAPFYAVGILSVVYHFANGVWTSLITWGITIGPQSQRISGRFCIGIGIVLAVLGLGSLRTFRTMDISGEAAPPFAADTPSVQPDLDDILCVLAGSEGGGDWPSACALGDLLTDANNCAPNTTLDLDDILAVLSAFEGNAPCADPFVRKVPHKGVRKATFPTLRPAGRLASTPPLRPASRSAQGAELRWRA